MLGLSSRKYNKETRAIASSHIRVHVAFNGVQSADDYYEESEILIVKKSAINNAGGSVIAYLRNKNYKNFRIISVSTDAKVIANSLYQRGTFPVMPNWAK